MDNMVSIESFGDRFYGVGSKVFPKLPLSLTSDPISIQPIWPVYVQSPYIIQNSGETTWFHIRGQGVQSQGEIVTKTYPAAPMLYYTSDEGKVYSIEINERQQFDFNRASKGAGVYISLEEGAKRTLR